MRAILLVHIISSMSNMKYLSSIALTISIVSIVISILPLAENRRANAECRKWEIMDERFPAFEWSELMIQQCEEVGYKTEIK